MKLAQYFWDLNATALKETKQALQDPGHPLFLKRMVTLLSRLDKPNDLFLILPKKEFLVAWPRIRSYWIKKDRRSEQRSWWEALCEQLSDHPEKAGTTSLRGQSVFLHSFGGVIKEARIKMGLSQQQLSHQTGIHQPALSKIEDGRMNMTLFTLTRLCRTLNIKTLDVS
jgi:DNA-binding XRE family transcriptional regulator